MSDQEITTTSESLYERASALYSEVASTYEARARALREQLDALSAEWDKAAAEIASHEISAGLSMWRHLLSQCPNQTCKCRRYRLAVTGVICSHVAAPEHPPCSRLLHPTADNGWTHAYEGYWDSCHEPQPTRCGYTLANAAPGEGPCGMAIAQVKDGEWTHATTPAVDMWHPAAPADADAWIYQ